MRDHGLAPKASRFEDTLLDLDAGVQLLADCGLARYILVGRAWGPIAFSPIRPSGKPAMHGELEPAALPGAYHRKHW